TASASSGASRPRYTQPSAARRSWPVATGTSPPPRIRGRARGSSGGSRLLLADLLERREEGLALLHHAVLVVVAGGTGAGENGARLGEFARDARENVGGERGGDRIRIDRDRDDLLFGGGREHVA